MARGFEEKQMTLVEQTNNTARQAILTMIRQRLTESLPFDKVHSEHHTGRKSLPILNSALALKTDLQNVSLIERFRENLISIGGNCRIVSDEQEAAREIQAVIDDQKASVIAVSDSPLVNKVCGLLKTNQILLKKATAAELFESDLGITGAQWAIAETGTLLLESDREFNRLASLVPPIHVAVLEGGFIRQTLGEILELVNENGAENLSRTVTFITGPSRTSDIELTLAIGVHGPAELHVIIIEN
jgi:L-lactate dehydrogenase complex protein LldG